jgi:hypothetical protein
VSDPEKLLHKRKERVIDSFYFLDINLSLPKDRVKIIDDLDFDIKFEQTLFRSKSESNLNEVLFDDKKFQSLILLSPFKLLQFPVRLFNQPKILLEPWQPDFLLFPCLPNYMIYLRIMPKELNHTMLKKMLHPENT